MRAFLKSMLPDRVLYALRALKHGPVSIEVKPAVAPREAAPPEDLLLGMTSAAEQSYFSECAGQLKGTPGAIVDLGCWMGSTCIALARGLGEDHGAQKIYAFDQFVWEDWMSYSGPKVYGDYRVGECFLPEARRRTERFRDQIVLVQADLNTYTWDRGEIKLLLVDAMKNARLAQAIARSFYSHLRPGAILIHQDYKHYYTSWIHVLQYRLRSCFRFSKSVAKGGTVAFTVTDLITHAAAEQASNFAVIEDSEVDAAFEYSLGLVGVEGRARVAAAHAMHFVHRREKAKAQERLARYQEPYVTSHGEFQRVMEEARILEGPA